MPGDPMTTETTTRSPEGSYRSLRKSFFAAAQDSPEKTQLGEKLAKFADDADIVVGGLVKQKIRQAAEALPTDQRTPVRLAGEIRAQGSNPRLTKEVEEEVKNSAQFDLTVSHTLGYDTKDFVSYVGVRLEMASAIAATPEGSRINIKYAPGETPIDLAKILSSLEDEAPLSINSEQATGSSGEPSGQKTDGKFDYDKTFPVAADLLSKAAAVAITAKVVGEGLEHLSGGSEGRDTSSKAPSGNQPEGNRGSSGNEAPPNGPPPENPISREGLSWNGESWHSILSQLRIAARSGLDPASAEMRELIGKKDAIVAAAERDGYLNGLDNILAQIDRQTITSSDLAGEVRARWADIGRIISGIDPTALERAVLARFSPEIARTMKEQYGGIWRTVQDTLSREAQIYQERALENPRVDETESKQFYLGVDSFIPASLRDIGRNYQTVTILERASQAPPQQSPDEIIAAIERLQEELAAGRKREVVDDELFDDTQYDEQFLSSHGLPSHIYVQVGIEIHRRDMRTALALASNISEFEGLSPINFIRGLIEDRKTASRESFGLAKDEKVDLTREELRGITIEGQKSYKQFVEGIIPLIITRKKDGGTFSSLVGAASPKPSATPEQVKGALGVSNFDLKMTAQAYDRDPVAKEMLGTWLAARGKQVGDLSPRGRDFANRVRPLVESMSAKNDTVLSRDEAVAVMDRIAKEMEGWFGVKPGQAQDMKELSNLLVEGPEIQDYRTKRTKGVNSVLWDTTQGGFREKILGRQTDEETAFSPAIDKVVFPQDEQPGVRKKRPLFLTIGLERVGVGGRDGLFDRISNLNNGIGLQFQYALMRNLTDGMDTVNEYIAGKDSFPDDIKRREEIAKIVDGWRVGDAPLLSSDDTLAAIKAIPVHVGKGELLRTGEAGFLERQGQAVERIINNAAQGLGPLAPKLDWNAPRQRRQRLNEALADLRRGKKKKGPPKPDEDQGTDQTGPESPKGIPGPTRRLQ